MSIICLSFQFGEYFLSFLTRCSKKHRGPRPWPRPEPVWGGARPLGGLSVLSYSVVINSADAAHAVLTARDRSSTLFMSQYGALVALPGFYRGVPQSELAFFSRFAFNPQLPPSSAASSSLGKQWALPQSELPTPRPVPALGWD